MFCRKMSKCVSPDFLLFFYAKSQRIHSQSKFNVTTTINIIYIQLNPTFPKQETHFGFCNEQHDTDAKLVGTNITRFVHLNLHQMHAYTNY